MRLRLLPALLLAIAAFGVGGSAAPSSTRAAGADQPGAELMRLTNLDRQALGRTPLLIDSTLVALARDAQFSCPTNHSLLYSGRAQDMATRGYFDHVIAGCGSTVLDVLISEFGYRTYRAENIAWNGYGTDSSTFLAGCDETGANCTGPATTTITSVAVAEQGFMDSAGHRANILGNYDRFGCGSATSTSGRTYFACLFSLGGPSGSGLSAPAISAPAGRIATIAPHFVVLSGVARLLAAGRGLTERATVADSVPLRQLSFWLDGRAIRVWSVSGVLAKRSFYLAPALIRRGTHSLGWAIRDVAGHTKRTAWTLVVE